MEPSGGESRPMSNLSRIEHHVIRRAVLADLPVLVELNAEYCSADGHAFDQHLARDGLEPLLVDDTHGSVWMILDHTGTIDGYAVLARSWSVEIGGAEMILDEIYVRTRGTGLGSRAIAELLRECASRRVKRVFLETEPPNDAARRLYERQGFTVEDSIWMSRTV
jgi:ribosomal protein S18 acetylase RimI-like enzyme